MILNVDIFNFLTVGFKETIPEISEEKVLGIGIDIKLSFKSHLKSVCTKNSVYSQEYQINNL